MKKLPQSEDEWRRTILFCFAVPYLTFSVLPLLSIHLLRIGPFWPSTAWRGVALMLHVFDQLLWPLRILGLALLALVAVYCFLDRRRAIYALVTFLVPIALWLFFDALNPVCQFREKPVIYLYPREPMKVHVSLTYRGVITRSAPCYGEDGWFVSATPDGTLVNQATGREYQHLFWEGRDTKRYNIETGFVVAGNRSETFLRDTLHVLGLAQNEINDFVDFWCPRLAVNPYNLISFPLDEYCRTVKLNIEPEPDSLIRVFMVFRKLTEPVDMPNPILCTPERTGFAVVEWGGTELK